jgi:hypothetical protein
MTSPLLGLADVFMALNDRVAQHGSQRAFARAVGVSEQLLSDVLHARRDPNDELLRAIGFKRVVRYSRMSNAEAVKA